MKNLYLDIDGTIITKQGCTEANHLFDFLSYAIENYDCYWLTSHCKGDALTALDYIENKVAKKSFELLKRFKPTSFELWKTEGINFENDFVWLDDYAFDGEIKILKDNNALQNLILIDLKSNPNHLLDIVSFLNSRRL